MSAERLRHLMDQLEGAAMATVHAQESTDVVVRDTLHKHARTYDEIAHEIEELVATSPEARAAFLEPPRRESA